MQIQSLNIERFGGKTNLFLDGIDDRLNVIFAPPGGGKSTCIDFVRWVLYGHDDTSSHSLSAPPQSGWGGGQAGSVNFMEAGGRHSIARQDDGSRYGRVAIDGDGRYARQSQHLVSLLGDVSRTDFDLLFAPRIDREHALSHLLQSSLARGMDLASHRLPSERVQDLRLRLDNYRHDLDRLPWHSVDLPGLLDRKRAIEERLDSQTDETRRRRIDYDRQYEELDRRIHEVESDVQRLRATWHTRDEEVATRRRELEGAWHASDDAKQDFLRQQRNELDDLESHLSRARSMQSEIQRRYDGLEAQLRGNDLDLDRKPRDIEESVCLVQSIAKQLDEMQTTVATDSRYTDVPRSPYRYRGSRFAPSATMEMLRGEVGQLCHTLQQERDDDRVRAMADELDHLRQCDAMMQRWVTGLSTQRDQLQRDLEDADRYGVTLVVDGSHDSATHLDRSDLEVYQSPLRTGRLRAVRHACDGYEPIDPERDAHLTQLTRQRDAAHAEVQAAERELSHLMARRRDLEAALGRLTDRELEAARRELTEVENHIRSAEERERLRHEISKLEAEIARWQDTVRNSPVTEHAIRILRRLTHNQYVGLRIDNTRNVSVEDTRGFMAPVEHLSRTLRDQVYLSFCLAIVTAHRGRGVQLPFLFHDTLVAAESETDGTLAAVLAEFAGMGQQVLVFTRHAHLAQQLRNTGARYFELGHQPPAPPLPIERAAYEQVDHVRFRPRPEVTISAPADRPYETVSPEHATRPVAGREYPSYPPPRPARSTAETGDRYDDERGGVDRPFEPTRSAIRARAATPPQEHLENVTFDNEQPSRGPESRQIESTTLSPESAIEATGTMDPDTASRLRAVGILTVGDFLQISPATAEDHLRSWGLESRPLRRWQDQLSLRCNVPGVNAEDARLLVACGISHLADLAETDVETLVERVGHLLSTHPGRSGERFRTRGDASLRTQIEEWIRAVRNRVKRSNGLPKQRRAPTSRPATPARGPEPPVAERSRRRSSGRSRRQRQRTADSAPQPSRPLRFYLNTSDPVVDAPTVGPRTAERLQTVGIHTVEDLLNADPIDLASRVDYRRITADAITEWQQQAVLACRVPLLRGHDAQILVACGVTDPAALAGMTAETLWERIEPFLDSAECKRIIRNGKIPDRREVRQWIRWAQDARALSS